MSALDKQTGLIFSKHSCIGFPAFGSMFGQRRSPLLAQCRSIVFESGSALKENCVIALTAIRVTLYAPEGHYTANTIHRPNCEIMLGHRNLLSLFLTCLKCGI